MLTQKQVNRMYSKMKRFENTLEPMIFTKVGETPARVYETPERLYEIPDDSLFARFYSCEPSRSIGACFNPGQFSLSVSVGFSHDSLA